MLGISNSNHSYKNMFDITLLKKSPHRIKFGKAVLNLSVVKTVIAVSTGFFKTQESKLQVREDLIEEITLNLESQ